MKRNLYAAGVLISIVLGTVSMTALKNTRILGPLLIAASLYLLIGCLIKLCKMNERLKDTILCAVDLLWWLP